ncbi:MAG TPA: hypothetical protein DEG44_00765 [Candidatus Kerfeldbacteria bacterium]|nr:hypothetical protein [Candidatus Kerfeldbacteria bacterium]
MLEVPDSIIQSLDTYAPQADEQVIYRDEAVDHSQLYTRTDILPVIGQVNFAIEFQHYFNQGEYDVDKVTFRYDNDDGLVGEMRFLLLPDGRYALSHRHVVEKYREKGVGERLLKQAEHTLQSLADRRKQPIHILIRLGQRGVLQWFKKRGYVPSAGYEDMVEAVVHHPERFVFDDIADKPSDDPIKRHEGIFLPSTVGRKIKDTVRINLEKTLTPQ